MAKAKAVPASTKVSLAGELVLGALIAELVGTFILTFAVLNTTGNAIVAAITVLILVLMLSRLSGGHINPAVTISLLVTRQITWVRALGYLVAQFLGAMLAVVVASNFLAGVTDQMTGEAAKVFHVTVSGDWKPFFAEMIGAVIFGFGVSAAVFGKKEGFDAAFTIGGALLLGLIIATSGSNAILNPAVALGAGALDFKNIWGPLAYGLAPLIGAAVGAFLYKLLQSDITLVGTKATKE
jgi:glycerol uptake facilitator-like aquaporin